MKKIPIKVSDATYQKLKKRKREDGFENKSWSEWAADMVKNEFLSDPLGKKIAKNTRDKLAKSWMKNLGENLSVVRKSKISLRDLASEGPNLEPAIVVGAGPSLWKNKHLEQLTEFKGKIVATDRMFVPLLKAGNKVDYVVSIDGHERLIPQFFDDPIVEESGANICLVLQTSPNTLRVCLKRGLKPYFFHTMQDDPRAENSSTRSIMYMTMSEANPLGVPAVPSGGNCGTTALAIAIDVLKHTHIGLVGFDFGYPKGTPIQETYYYSTIFNSYQKKLKNPGIASTHALTHFQDFYHPVFKTYATSDPVFDGYRESLYEILSYKTRPCKIYNLSQGGTLYNPSLFKCMTLDKFFKLTAQKKG